MNPLPPPLPRGGRRSYEMGEDPSRLLSALAAQHGAHLPSMMAPFRHARRVNPSAHDAKLRFWAAALRDLVVDKGVGLDSRYTVDAKSLPGALVVDGVAPQALPHALAALKRDGDLADPSAFLVADARDTPRHNSTWTGTLVSALLVAPLTWGLATLGVVDPSDSGSNIDEEVHAGALVVPARVDADVSLLATVARNTASRLDALLTPSELLDRAGLHSAGLSRADIELLLAHAARRGVLAIDQSSTGTTTMVKLARASDEGTAVSIADVDRHAFRVKTAAELVARQAADVEAKADVHVFFYFSSSFPFIY
ncbi:hypothetical protein BC828DRAFT_184851 [Blastocladiella britannica]|nr:hypothetical protein BC828DRAFT_184851 [Blastocladiella britannica]